MSQKNNKKIQKFVKKLRKEGYLMREIVLKLIEANGKDFLLSIESLSNYKIIEKTRSEHGAETYKEFFEKLEKIPLNLVHCPGKALNIDATQFPHRSFTILATECFIEYWQLKGLKNTEIIPKVLIADGKKLLLPEDNLQSFTKLAETIKNGSPEDKNRINEFSAFALCAPFIFEINYTDPVTAFFRKFRKKGLQNIEILPELFREHNRSLFLPHKVYRWYRALERQIHIAKRTGRKKFAEFLQTKFNLMPPELATLPRGYLKLELDFGLLFTADRVVLSMINEKLHLFLKNLKTDKLDEINRKILAANEKDEKDLTLSDRIFIDSELEEVASSVLAANGKDFTLSDRFLMDVEFIHKFFQKFFHSEFKDKKDENIMVELCSEIAIERARQSNLSNDEIITEYVENMLYYTSKKKSDVFLGLIFTGMKKYLSKEAEDTYLRVILSGVENKEELLESIPMEFVCCPEKYFTFNVAEKGPENSEKNKQAIIDFVQESLDRGIKLSRIIPKILKANGSKFVLSEEALANYKVFKMSFEKYSTGIFAVNRLFFDKMPVEMTPTPQKFTKTDIFKQFASCPNFILEIFIEYWRSRKEENIKIISKIIEKNNEKFHLPESSELFRIYKFFQWLVSETEKYAQTGRIQSVLDSINQASPSVIANLEQFFAIEETKHGDLVVCKKNNKIDAKEFLEREDVKDLLSKVDSMMKEGRI